MKTQKSAIGSKEFASYVFATSIRFLTAGGRGIPTWDCKLEYSIDKPRIACSVYGAEENGDSPEESGDEFSP